MIQFTQNNKIAIAAVMIFLVSFSVMLFSINGEKSSPEYIQSSVLDATPKSSSKSHVYFSEPTDTSKEGASSAHGETSQVATTSSHGATTASPDLESSYRSVIENSEDPFFVLFPEGKVKSFSKNFTENYGLTVDDFKKDNFFSVIYADDLSDFAGEYTSVLQSAKAKNGTGPYRFVKKDSGISVQIISLIPVIDDNKKVTEIVGVIKDITSKMADFSNKSED